MSLTEDFNPITSGDIQWRGMVGTTLGSADRNLVVIFYKRPVHDPARSRIEGRPYYKDVIYVKVHPPGERLNIKDAPATQGDARRFPVQWQQFKQQEQQTPDGTRLEFMFPDKPSKVSTYQAHGVWVVEQLAALSADAIETIGMGCQRDVNDAQRYLEQSRKGVDAAQFRAEMEERDSEIRTLKHQIDLLKEQLNRNSEGTSAQAEADMIAKVVAEIQRRQGRPEHGANPIDASVAQINALGAERGGQRPPRPAPQPMQALGDNAPLELPEPLPPTYPAAAPAAGYPAEPGIPEKRGRGRPRKVPV